MTHNAHSGTGLRLGPSSVDAIGSQKRFYGSPLGCIRPQGRLMSRSMSPSPSDSTSRTRSHAGLFSHVVYSQGRVVGVSGPHSQPASELQLQGWHRSGQSPVWPRSVGSDFKMGQPQWGNHNGVPDRLGNTRYSTVEERRASPQLRMASLPAMGRANELLWVSGMQLYPRAAPLGVAREADVVVSDEKRPILSHTASEPGSPSYMRSTGSTYLETRRNRERQEAMLLPYTPNVFCNWSACGEAKIAALLATLADVWGNDSGVGLPGCFFDLGCGDGRVILEFCKSFPERRGVGVDLNPSLIDWARSRAKLRNLQDRCEFYVGDFADASLDDAAAVFMFLPRPGVNFILKHVFPKCGIRVGTALFSADGPLPPCANGSYERLNSRSIWTEKEGLFCYTWLGLCNNGPAEKQNNNNQ